VINDGDTLSVNALGWLDIRVAKYSGRQVQHCGAASSQMTG
jgi:hypothetical protein